MNKKLTIVGDFSAFIGLNSFNHCHVVIIDKSTFYIQAV